jgi:hypothetical protein
MTERGWRKGPKGSAEERQHPEKSGKENECRETLPRLGSPGRMRRKIVSPRQEEHKYAVPWAIVD